MILKAYCVYDSKAKVFSQPIFLQNDAVMLREFVAMVNSQNNQVGRNPEDFTLYSVGEFDDSRGALVALDPLVNLGLASNFKELA